MERCEIQYKYHRIQRSLIDNQDAIEMLMNTPHDLDDKTRQAWLDAELAARDVLDANSQKLIKVLMIGMEVK